MKVILYFRLGNNYYLFYKDKLLIKLGRIDNNKILNINDNDAAILREMIKTLCNSTLDKEDLYNKNFEFLDSSELNLNEIYGITLSFSSNKEETFLSNCASIEKDFKIKRTITDSDEEIKTENKELPEENANQKNDENTSTEPQNISYLEEIQNEEYNNSINTLEDNEESPEENTNIPNESKALESQKINSISKEPAIQQIKEYDISSEENSLGEIKEKNNNFIKPSEDIQNTNELEQEINNISSEIVNKNYIEKNFEILKECNSDEIIEDSNKKEKRKQSINETIKNEKKQKNNKKILIAFILVLVCLASCFIGCIIYKMDKQKFLEKYTYGLDKKINISNVEIKNIDNVNFYDSFIDFYSPYTELQLQRSTNINSNVYKNAEIVMTISNTENEKVNITNNSLKSNEYNLEKILENNNIDNSFKLMYECLINYDNKVSIDSSKKEIIKKYILDEYLSNIQKDGRYIVFTGDKEGYAYITDNEISININNIRITYTGFNEILNDEEISNLVASIKFKTK